jgi:hypothetical protein
MAGFMGRLPTKSYFGVRFRFGLWTVSWIIRMVTLFRLLFGVAGFGGILLYRFSVVCEYRFTVGDAAAPARKSAELFLYGSRSVVHRRPDVGKLGVRGRYQLDSRSRGDNLRIGGCRSAVTFPLGRNGVSRTELIKALRRLRTNLLAPRSNPEYPDQHFPC